MIIQQSYRPSKNHDDPNCHLNVSAHYLKQMKSYIIVTKLYSSPVGKRSNRKLLYEYTLDICKIFNRKNAGSMIVNLFLEFFRNYVTLPTKCPFGPVCISHFHPIPFTSNNYFRRHLCCPNSIWNISKSLWCKVLESTKIQTWKFFSTLISKVDWFKLEDSIFLVGTRMFNGILRKIKFMKRVPETFFLIWQIKH